MKFMGLLQLPVWRYTCIDVIQALQNVSAKMKFIYKKNIVIPRFLLTKPMN